MGRFMSPDWSDAPDTVPYADLKNPKSLNMYAYVGNNPLSQTDADGHHQECAPDTSSTGADGSVTVTAGACHEVADHWWQIPSAWLQNVKAKMDANAIAHAPPQQAPSNDQALQDLNNIMMGMVPAGASARFGWKNGAKWRQAVKDLMKTGTHETVAGEVPTRAEATEMIQQGGGISREVELESQWTLANNLVMNRAESATTHTRTSTTKRPRE